AASALRGAGHGFGVAARWSVIPATLLAVVVPTIYVNDRLPQLAQRCENMLRSGHLWRGWKMADAIATLRPSQAISGRPACEVVSDLDENLQRLVNDSLEPLQAGSSDAAIVRRARQLSQLDELNAAKQLLIPLADRSPEACQLLANV